MHAYLIMAHNNFEQLKLLIKALDYKDNDIYLHIDTKATDFDKTMFDGVLQNAGIFYVDRMSVIWGDYSQIQCELLLLQAACKKEYEYLHLLSGVDFPIKTHESIVKFFADNKGKEFLHFESKGYPAREKYKIQYWYLLHKFTGRKKASESVVAFIQWITLQFQKLIRIDRTKNSHVEYYKGANWFSITGDFANYVLSQRELVERIFSYTHCGDEFFLQTLIMNSPYKDNISDCSFSDDYNSCLRLIDWNRGTPYTFTIEDYEELLKSECLFARKFDLKKDPKIIEQLLEL